MFDGRALVSTTTIRRAGTGLLEPLGYNLTPAVSGGAAAGFPEGARVHPISTSPQTSNRPFILPPL